MQEIFFGGELKGERSLLLHLRAIDKRMALERQLIDLIPLGPIRLRPHPTHHTLQLLPLNNHILNGYLSQLQLHLHQLRLLMKLLQFLQQLSLLSVQHLDLIFFLDHQQAALTDQLDIYGLDGLFLLLTIMAVFILGLLDEVLLLVSVQFYLLYQGFLLKLIYGFLLQLQEFDLRSRFTQLFLVTLVEILGIGCGIHGVRRFDSGGD